ncbi:MAG: glycoside hydrolase family 11 protein [Oscillospiraceae bacterium]|nr:glycoside hydrolase family 11 protein [Oscillospiraceae bacterium]
MKYTKLFFCIVLTILLIVCVSVTSEIFYGSVSGGINQETKVVTETEFGNWDDYDYGLWKDYGDTKMTIGRNGTYESEWHDTHNVVFRTGHSFYDPRPVSSFGKIDLQYGAEYHPDGDSFLGVYGWMKEPLVEFYIVENWGDARPDDKHVTVEGRTYLGTYTVQNVEYEVYSTVRENQPSIIGTRTFVQYWSIRTEPSCEGTVCISDHFTLWESLGLKLGRIHEISFGVEGIESSGYAKIYMNDLRWDGNPYQ